MPGFSDHTLNQVRAVGIEKIVEPYVELRQKGGRDLWGLCPFHNENSPSFKVDLERGFFKCFGCDAKGDGITFIMRRLGFSYPDAVVFIAERFGINVEYDGEDNKNRKDIQSLHNDIQIMLRKFFYDTKGAEARKYILSRSFNDDDLNEFGIGYIPARVDFSEIYKKYPLEVLISSGFFKEGHSGSLFSRFFERLTLPIKNITGSIAAFAGRSLDGSLPKYLNSAESDLFHKRETLFNIDKAKSAMKTGGCIVVEGYFDVMRLYKIGIKNAVAPMGTALTANQAALIRRYSGDVTVVFDGDEAGEKAAYRSLPVFIEGGVFPKAVFLPKEDDPDSFCLREGRDGWNSVFSKREDLFINVFNRQARFAGNDFNKKLIRFQDVKKMLASIKDPHIRDYYSEAASDIFGLKKENVISDIANVIQERSLQKQGSANNKKSGKNSLYLCEMDFIACLSYLAVDVVDGIVCDMSEDMFMEEAVRVIFKKILEVLERITDIKEIVHELGEHEGKFIEIASREIVGDIYKAALLNKEQIVRNHLKCRQLEVIGELKNDKCGADAKISLMKELDELTRRLARQGDL